MRTAQIPFDEEQVRKHFRLVHRPQLGVTPLVVITPYGIYNGFFNDEDALVTYCRSHHGDGIFYVACNPYLQEVFNSAPNQLGCVKRGGKDKVAAITTVFLDIDPVRPKGIPATQEENKLAIAKARELTRLSLFQESTIATSGNGAYVIIPVEFTEDLDTREKQIEALVKKIRREHFSGQDKLDLDSVHDRAHLMALMGCLKTKGTASAERPYRLARFLSEPKSNPCQNFMEEVRRQSIGSSRPSARGPKPGKKLGRPRISPRQRASALCAGCRQVFENPPRYEDRSDFDLLFTAALIDHGFTEKQVFDLLADLDQRRPEVPGKSPRKFTARSEENQRAYVSALYRDADPNYDYCHWIWKLLGSKACKEGCPHHSANLSSGKYKLTRAPNVKSDRKVTLEQARSALATDLKARRERLLAEKSVLIVKGLPGLGKTHLACQEFKDLRLFYCIGLREELPMIQSDLGGGVALQLKDNLCRFRQDLRDFRNQGYPEREMELCRSCNRAQCDYFQQFDTRQSWIGTTKYLTTSLELKNFDLIVIDEDPLRDLLDKTEVDHDQIRAFRRFLETYHLRTAEAGQLLTGLEDLMDAYRETGRKDEEMNLLTRLFQCLENPQALIQRYHESPEFQQAVQLAENLPARLLPPKSIFTLIHRLYEEATRARANSLLGLELVRGSCKIVIRRFQDLDRLRDFPVLILDSSADQMIYEQIFPGRSIEILDYEIEVRAQVVQITNSPLGVYGLQSKKTLQRVMEFIQEHQEGRVGIICRKQFEVELERNFHGAMVKHYGNVRGSREFEDCDSLFLVGGAFLPPLEPWKIAQTVFYDQPKVSRDKIMRGRDYGMAKHNQRIYGLWEHKDERVRAISQWAQEQEIMQAGYRIRPLQHPKKIFILTNIPVPGLPPEKLLKLTKNETFERYQKTVEKLISEEKDVNNHSVSKILGITPRQGRKYKNRLPVALFRKRKNSASA